MNDFLEAIEKNEELKKRVEELKKRGATPADLSALAREYGFNLTEEDFSGTGQNTGELSEDELDALSGGSGGGWFNMYCWEDEGIYCTGSRVSKQKTACYEPW